MVVTVRFHNPPPDGQGFRELTLDGRKIVSRGAVKTNGAVTPLPETTTRCATEATAQSFFDQAVENIRKHFTLMERVTRDVDQPDTTSHRPASNPKLEARVVDADGSQVFADWLQSQGDLRGELAALHVRGDHDRAMRFFEMNLAAFLGALEPELDHRVRDLVWRNGFLAGATLKTDSQREVALDELTRRFLGLPIARFVTELRFGLAGSDEDNDWEPTLNEVTSWVHAKRVTTLRFDAFDSDESDLAYVGFGDFSAAWKKLPSLEILHIRSGEGGALGALELPTLRTFIRESGALHVSELEAIIAARWPMLERLDVWFGRAAYGSEGTVEHAMRIVQSAPASLRHLGIINSEFLPAFVAAFAASPLLKRLTVLDLAKGTLIDEDVDLFLAHRAAYAHLQRIDVSENLLNTRGDELRAALPNVVLGTQRYGAYANENDRYAAVGE